MAFILELQRGHTMEAVRLPFEPNSAPFAAFLERLRLTLLTYLTLAAQYAWLHVRYP